MRRVTKEEYIETVYILEKDEGKAATGRIAERMDIKPPSVTQMLGKLQEEGLVEYEPYLGATLTPVGKEMARELMAKHKIIASFLEILGVDQELAERDACQIEHQVSPETAARLKAFVKFVQEDQGICPGDGVKDPRWVERFKKFYETGDLEKCTRSS